MKTLITIPQNVQLIEKPYAFYWLGHDGYIYFVGKKSSPITIPEAKNLLEDFKMLAGGNKFVLLGDITLAVPANNVLRDYVAIEFPKYVSAIALLSGSPLGRMVANLFIAIKPTPYPAKMFGTVGDAQDWLKQFV